MALLGFVGSLLKKKPKVPDFKPVNLGDEQASAIGANRANFSAASGLTSDVNAFNQAELMKRLESIVPDIGAIQGQASKNIASMLRGELPEDVSSAVSRTAAAKAFSGGYGGSGFGRALTTRDLGLTSLNMTQQGLDNASRWLQTASNTMMAPQMDVTSMFITPQQQAANTWQNRQVQFQNQWMQNQLNAAHDPMNLFGNALQQADAQLFSLAGSFLGGGGSSQFGGSNGAAAGTALAKTGAIGMLGI